MTDQAERYDRISRGYARWWAPVLRPTALRVLDRLEPLVADGARRVLDLGTGTATLAVAAIQRWPKVEVVGIDASAGMAEAARAEADRLLGPADRRRFRVEVAFADRLPLRKGEIDAAMSSFVLQLVPSRYAALREVHRVLGPGGRMAHATWLVGDRRFRPDDVLDDVLDEAGIGAREPEGRRGDYESVEAAVGGMRRAGFRHVEAERMDLVHPFDAASYQGFIEEFDEEDTFASMSREERRRVSGRFRERLEALPRSAFELRLPVVLAHGDRG
ncbi:MAG TPA: class I SAM-dependent methyltransferase [Candidatus Limnocylindrales bacterium]